MQHYAVFLGVVHLARVKYVASGQAFVDLGVFEALALDAGHVQHVQIRQGFFQVGGLRKRDAVGLHFFYHVLRQFELFGGDQHEAVALVAAHGGYQGVHGAPVEQVAADAYLEAAHVAFFAVYGKDVGQRLCGVVVAAVAGVDDRNRGRLGHYPGGARQVVPYGADVRVAAYHAGRVRKRFALGKGRACGSADGYDAASELVHGRLEGKARARGGLKEQRGQLFAFAAFGVVLRFCDDVQSLVH